MATPIVHAYRNQRRTTKERCLSGDRVIGYKIGCVSEEFQQQLNLDCPIYGRLFESQQNALVSNHLKHYRRLGLEGELAVSLATDPRNLPTSMGDIERAILDVFPVIEFHEILQEDTFEAHHLIESNGMHVGYKEGRSRGRIGLDNLSLTISMNGEQVAHIGGHDLWRQVVDSLSWLSDILAIQEGRNDLLDHCTVLCGTLAPLYPVYSSTLFDVDAGLFGRVTCEIR